MSAATTTPPPLVVLGEGILDKVFGTLGPVYTTVIVAAALICGFALGMVSFYCCCSRCSRGSNKAKRIEEERQSLVQPMKDMFTVFE